MYQWIKSDKKIARKLFELARERDYKKLTNTIQHKANNLEIPKSIWTLRDFLNSKAKEFDQKYDYRYSVLDDVFANFICEGLLNLSELQPLSIKKQKQIRDILNILGKLS